MRVEHHSKEWQEVSLYYYVLIGADIETGAAMTDKQIRAAVDFLAGRLDKASFGCLLVGMFQPAHKFGGIVGSVICFLSAGALRIWEAKE